MRPKYPDIAVQLSGEDGNAFAIIGRVRKAMRRAGLDKKAIKEFTDEATSGDYDHVIGTALRFVDVH